MARVTFDFEKKLFQTSLKWIILFPNLILSWPTDDMSRNFIFRSTLRRKRQPYIVSGRILFLSNTRPDERTKGVLAQEVSCSCHNTLVFGLFQGHWTNGPGSRRTWVEAIFRQHGSVADAGDDPEADQRTLGTSGRTFGHKLRRRCEILRRKIRGTEKPKTWTLVQTVNCPDIIRISHV